MPEFADPFRGKVPDRKITLGELVRALRLDAAAEEEATHLYMSQADATDNQLAQRVLVDIANEERVHIGEFRRLIQLLTGDEDKFLADGAREVAAMAAKVAGLSQAPPAGETTIGSLK